MWQVVSPAGFSIEKGRLREWWDMRRHQDMLVASQRVGQDFPEVIPRGPAQLLHFPEEGFLRAAAKVFDRKLIRVSEV